VRECHGDLHTRNIVRQGGRLLAFDCVEFEPAFRWIDVADDIAFLSADLETLDAPLLAWSFLQAYFTAGGDWQACRLLPLYQAHRALVRAKVAALSAGEDPAARRELLGRHRAYLDHAVRVLGPRRPCVLLMSGLSGSGKTWLATRLAPQLRALHLRSDVERKRRAGLGPLASSESGLQRALYAADATATLYHQLLTNTADIVAGGHDVIVDATFLRADDRAAWRALAAATGLPYLLVHCTAPAALLRQRIEQRRATAADASEASLEVLDWQLQRAEPFAAGERATLIEADTSRADVAAMVLGAVRAALQSAAAASAQT
jgi:predicted kinase